MVSSRTAARKRREYDGPVTGPDRGPGGEVTSGDAIREEERRLRRALERAAAQWRTTFDAIASPIINLDIDGRINRLNRAARDLTGLDYPDLLGRPVGQVGGGVLFERVGELAAEARSTGLPATANVDDRETGVVWDVAAQLRCAAPEVDDELVVVVARDISRLVELQESLRRSEMFSALGSLVGGVAHQVRNPLFGISAAVDAFEARFGDLDGAARYVAALREPVGRLSKLINALLEYGKPSRLDTERTDLAVVVAGAVCACGVLAEQRHVGLEWRPPGRALPIEVDPARLHEALVNVIENAVQHSDEGGEVEIGVGDDPQQNNGSRWACCSVRDHGPGFLDEDVARVCDPFFSRRHGGTGLGLALVQRAVHDNGGRLRLANAAGGGAVVRISFPRVDGGGEV